MPTVADSLVDRSANTLQELIGRSAREFASETDPIFRKLILGSAKVDGGADIGRDMRLKKRFYGSMTGVIEGGHLSNHADLYGDATQAFGSKMYRQLLAQTYPNPLNGVHARGYGFTSILYSLRMSFALTLQQMQLDALPANIREHVAPTFRGFARNIANRMATSWYADSSRQYRLSDLGPSTGDGAYDIDLTNFKVTFYPPDLTASKFATGQAVDLWSDETTRANQGDAAESGTFYRVRGFVESSDPWTNKVVLIFDPTEKTENGGTATFATWTATLGEDAFVTHAYTYNSGFKDFYNWRDFLKAGNPGGAQADNYILGSNAITDTADDYIDTSVHTEFRSGKYTGIGALTRNKFLGILSNVFGALEKWGYDIDTIIAGKGILLNMFEQQLGKEVFNYSGGGSYVGAVSPMGLKDTGDGGFTITHEGKTLSIYESRFQTAGTLCGIKRAGNISIVAPPNSGMIGAGAPGGVGSSVEKIPIVFPMNALTGGSAPNFPILNGDGEITEGTQFPCFTRCQIQPDTQIPGFWMEDINYTQQFSE